MPVVTDLHQSANHKSRVYVPALVGRKASVLGTRTPHRPNPIGLSLVKVTKIVGHELHVSGIDVVDGTPVLDVKPYIAHIEAIVSARAPSWVEVGT